MWEKPSYEIIELGCEITAYLFSEPDQSPNPGIDKGPESGSKKS